MKLAIFSFLLFTFTITGYCNDANYFEIKFNKSSIYNSTLSTDQTVKLGRDTIAETDLLEINYVESGLTAKNEYELHIQVLNTKIDLTFINDLPTFTLNMGWFTQFTNKHVIISLKHIKFIGGAPKEYFMKIVDFFISTEP